MLRILKFLFVIIFGLSLGLVAPLFDACAAPSKPTLLKHPELQIPARLRPRVNFWIDVFGIYGKAQVIIHHRRFPQIRFALLDIEDQTAGMNDVLFDSYKDRALKAKLKEVREDIAHLASGAAPKTTQQRNIEQSMRLLGTGMEKYKRIIEDPELVRGQSGIRDKMAEAIERSGRYLPIIESIFESEFDLPVELTRLPFVESSFNYKAYSSAAAAGIWQFIPSTGRSFMRISPTIDERLDPIEASRAAAKYLRSAHSRLGTWPLALTSYNHGVAGVLNKVRKFGTADISSLIENGSATPPFGFASANFFPSYLAAKEIYDQRGKFFPGVRPEPSLHLATMRLTRALSITDVKKRLGISEDELRLSNYAFSERIWRAQALIPAGYNLKVPKRYEARLIKSGFGTDSENFDVGEVGAEKNIISASNQKLPRPEAAQAEVSSGKEIQAKQGNQKVASAKEIEKRRELTYKVKAGDTLYSIARQYGVSVPALKEENGIKGSSIFLGKILKIPGDISSPVRTKSSPARSDSLVKLYTVKKGDSLGAIAKSMDVPLAKLLAKNGLSAKKPHIKPGQVLKIPIS